MRKISSGRTIQPLETGIVQAIHVRDGDHVTRNDMQIDNRTVPLSPGMAVTVEVKTGSRRLIEYVMSPVLRYRQESMRER